MGDVPSAIRSQPAIATSGQQHTLGQSFTRSGIGLHSGMSVQVRVVPAPAGTGRCFVRVDLPEAPEIPATVESVSQTTLSTELQQGEATVRTVEHLLAALVALGVDNVRIELDGAEIPLLDGSAQGWTEAIVQTGLVAQSIPRPHRAIAEPVWIQEGDAFVAALPATETRFTYGINFDLPAIGNQWHSWSDSAAFVAEIAPARTFGLLSQIDYLREKGLIRGGSLDNALVCGPDGWVNPPLRFANEPARHKLLDLVGDLSLLGYIPVAHYLAYKASHHLHTQLARSLAQRL
jgi:UDP-3-O-[3-hydroxymyristoyl] N-acetylglucosamine deacetylase